MRSVRGRLPTLATLLLRWKIPTSTLKSRNPLKDIAHILSILRTLVLLVLLFLLGRSNGLLRS